MNTKLLNKLAVLLSLAGALSASAGTISVVNLPTTGTDAATGINTGKTYVNVFDYGSLNTTTYSVNGVPFTHVRSAAQNVYVTTNFVDSTHGGQVIVSVSAAFNK